MLGNVTMVVDDSGGVHCGSQRMVASSSDVVVSSVATWCSWW